MYPIYFKALLKTADGRVMEEGYACISPENKSVDFKNDFVPLMKMGVTAKIVQLSNDRQELQCFEGIVYLSGNDLLRIVSVDDEALAQAQRQLEVNTSIQAQVMAVHQGFSLLRFAQKKAEWEPVEIYSLSTDNVKFTSPNQYLTGQKLTLQAEKPVLLRKMVLEVYQAILFGDNLTGHLCTIESIPEPYSANLARYVEEINHSRPELLPGQEG